MTTSTHPHRPLSVVPEPAALEPLPADAELVVEPDGPLVDSDDRSEIPAPPEQAVETAPNAVRARPRARLARFRSAGRKIPVVAAGHAAAWIRGNDPADLEVRPSRWPNIVVQDRPSLRRVWRHAIWGEQVPHGGAARVLYVAAWCVFCAAPVAVGYLIAWWHERLLRIVAGYALLWALWHVDPVREVLQVAWQAVTVLARFVT